ncbi:Golgi-associated plant pathogenesis-related protein 1 [Hydra vulgaris]|uniref:Golgi-associated plant pathogenesis-related protein 1 n=1 Tax=Hydra vulgaris TaxID=6087 RepID=UPI001F5EDC2A|nr:Golgi-associated plant pathogenesis-related protein 1-like [Hydra vulgaris]
MTRIKHIPFLALAFMLSPCLITADVEVKEEVIKTANNVVNCNTFFNLCLPKCSSYQGYSVKCSTATDSTGKQSYNKDGTSCLCKGSEQVKPVTPVVPVVPLKSLDDFRKSILASHNLYRKKHNAPSLQLSDELNAMAQNWAENIARTGNVQHSPPSLRNGAGENMYYEWSSVSPPSGENAVKVWYEEVMYWNFMYNGDYLFPLVSNQVSHFTQVIWKSTSKLGCGRAYNGNKVYVVCEYREAGNLVGSFSKNIYPPNA